MSTVASPGRLLAYIGAPPQPFIQRPALAGGFIQRLLAVPTPCRPLERAVPVPCQRASIAAQARARGRAVLGTSTGEAGPGRFRTGPNQHRARAGPMGQARLENFNGQELREHIPHPTVSQGVRPHAPGDHAGEELLGV